MPFYIAWRADQAHQRVACGKVGNLAALLQDSRNSMTLLLGIVMGKTAQQKGKPTPSPQPPRQREGELCPTNCEVVQQLLLLVTW